LFLVAAGLALVVTYPHEVLLAMAYAYFVSGFVGVVMTKLGRRPEMATEPDVEPKAKKEPHPKRDVS
jgi:hypothetical protein